MAATAAPRYICFLCKRKFESSALLTRHKQLSELHRKNLQKQEEDIHHKKDELRQAMAFLRRQIQDVEATTSGKQVQVASDEGAQSQRTTLELKLRQAVGEYGQVQEKLEGNKEVQEDRYMMNIQLEAPGGQRIAGFCVLDGHSGSLCVDALMQHYPRNLQKCLAAKPSLTEDTLRQAVTEACVLTDDEFLARAREREVLDGSTMLTCFIYQEEGHIGADGTRSRGAWKMLLANLGDSRAVMCRSQGAGRLSAVRLTDDHKPGRADERRRIEAKGGVVDVQGVWRVFTPGPASFGGRSVLWGLAVSRAFGDLLMKEPQRYGCVAATGELVTAVPEIHTYDLHPTEDRFLVLACDGIWDVLDDDAAIAVCVEHRTADLAAHALIRRSFEVGSDDNLTAMVISWQVGDVEAAPAADAGETKKARLD